MIIKSLEVENFGPFRGKHLFDLAPVDYSRHHRPLIIVGGKNGTGKTTLFEAIKLCLYGDYFEGKRMSRRMYHRYLQQRLHRSEEGKVAPYASITVRFSYANLGYINNYLVKRSWRYIDSEISESFEIKQNGELIWDVDEDQWQDFLMDLIPPKLSKLFFFDGEQIQSLAEKTRKSHNNKTKPRSFCQHLNKNRKYNLQNTRQTINIKIKEENYDPKLPKPITTQTKHFENLRLPIKIFTAMTKNTTKRKVTPSNFERKSVTVSLF